jgi:peptide-methionine (S)-S-oxide reductase
VTSGYSGGYVKSPSYESVSTGVTGHAESVSITYDPTQITYGQLLMVFFCVAHDPTQRNRQGPDTGSQYRSVIFYTTPEQKTKAENYIKEINNSTENGKPIVTEVLPLDKFYIAENYHKDYYEHHKDEAYCELVINPKLEKVQHKFENLLKDNPKK